MTEKEKQTILNHPLNSIYRYLFGIDVLFPPRAPALACVYAMEMSDNTVKIGVTRKLDKRIKSVSSAVYLDVLNVHSTEFAPFGFMRIIESRCHAAFADKRVRGEFFSITFAEACAELDRHAEEITAELKVADKKFQEKMEHFKELQPDMAIKKDVPAFEIDDERLNMLCDKFETITKLLKELKAMREETTRLRERNAILQSKADYCDAVLDSDELIDVGLIAMDYGFTEETFNKILADFQIQYQTGGAWNLQQRYSGKNYAHLNSNGEPAWTQRGRYFLYHFLKEHGLVPVHERLAKGA